MRWDNQIGSSASGSTNNSLYFSKGDYLAFREVSLSYMLPLSWIRKMRLSAVEVFAGAYNIGYIKKYDGMFPEIYTGVDYGIYPRPRQYNMGVKMCIRDRAIGGFGATFAAIYSWHTTFHWFGIIGVGYGIILAFFLRDKERGNVSENQKMKKIPVLKSLGMLFSNVFFWVILFYFCVPGTPGWAAKNWLPTLFSDSLSIDISVAGPMSVSYTHLDVYKRQIYVCGSRLISCSLFTTIQTVSPKGIRKTKIVSAVISKALRLRFSFRFSTRYLICPRTRI